MDNFYESRTFDYIRFVGDTVNLKFEFFDRNGNPINNIAVNQWGCTFTLRDPITYQPIAALQKTHNDATPGGAGIYFNGDIQMPANLNITADNQIVIVLDHEDTETLKALAYPFDIQFEADQAYNSILTALEGRLILRQEHTVAPPPVIP